MCHIAFVKSDMELIQSSGPESPEVGDTCRPAAYFRSRQNGRQIVSCCHCVVLLRSYHSSILLRNRDHLALLLANMDTNREHVMVEDLPSLSSEKYRRASSMRLILLCFVLWLVSSASFGWLAALWGTRGCERMPPQEDWHRLIEYSHEQRGDFRRQRSCHGLVDTSFNA